MDPTIRPEHYASDSENDDEYDYADNYANTDAEEETEDEYDYEDVDDDDQEVAAVDSDDDGDDGAAFSYVTVYSRDQLLGTTSSAERRYIKSRPGICAGMSLAWLQHIVRDGTHPMHSWPSVSHSRRIQEHIEENYIRYTKFPEIGYMRNDGMKRFSSVDDGLGYVWQNPGSYMLLIRPRREYIGHAVAYSDASSYPRGYIMNPNNGNHCCHTYDGLASQFRSDPFIYYSENNRYGADFVIAKIVRENYESDSEADANHGDYRSRKSISPLPGRTSHTFSTMASCRAAGGSAPPYAPSRGCAHHLKINNIDVFVSCVLAAAGRAFVLSLPINLLRVQSAFLSHTTSLTAVVAAFAMLYVDEPSESAQQSTTVQYQ
eukprot:IDg10468t1